MSAGVSVENPEQAREKWPWPQDISFIPAMQEVLPA